MTGLSRPRLALKARLRRDRHEDRWLLLYPERGLILNRSAGDILRLCTGRLTVDRIVDLLAARYGDSRRDAIMADALALLCRLHARGLIQD